METLNLEQAAAFLNMHPVTVQAIARAGEIPATTLFYSLAQEVWWKEL